jgi:hypothetical protein
MNNLPFEILDKIRFYLDLYSAKNLAETCNYQAKSFICYPVVTDQYALIKAVSFRKKDCIRKIIKKIQTEDLKDQIELCIINSIIIKDQDIFDILLKECTIFYSSILIAAKWGRLEMLKKLLEKDKSFKAFDVILKTSIMSGYIEMSSYLISLGIEPDPESIVHRFLIVRTYINLYPGEINLEMFKQYEKEIKFLISHVK